MIEKGKISALQMALMMHPTILATALLLVPAITGKYAKQDMWISPIWASFVGFLVVYIAHQFNRKFPKETVIQFSEKLVGFIPGKIIGFVFLFFYIHTMGIILREYGEFVIGNFLKKTPLIVVIGSLVIVCALAVHGGLEVIARSAQIFVPVVIFLLLIVTVLLIGELEPQNMFPVMEKGMVPSLMGALVPASWFTEYFLISFLFPFIADREKGFKWGMISVFMVLFMMVMTNLFTLFLFGDITTTFTYPVMSAARYINIADFLQHLESFIMAIWVAGTFVKISVFYYVIVIGTAQWLNLSDYHPIVYPLGFLCVCVSIWSASGLGELSYFISTIWPFYAISIQVIIPIILLLIAVLRKGTFPKEAGSSTLINKS